MPRRAITTTDPFRTMIFRIWAAVLERGSVSRSASPPQCALLTHLEPASNVGQCVPPARCERYGWVRRGSTRSFSFCGFLCPSTAGFNLDRGRDELDSLPKNEKLVTADRPCSLPTVWPPV